MAIVCSRNGQFFDVPDAVLSQYAKKPEELSKDVLDDAGLEGPDATGCCERQGDAGGMGGAGAGGAGGATSPIQIIVNYVYGGSGGGGAMQGPPAGQSGSGQPPSNQA